jgi:hypothetical protein
MIKWPLDNPKTITYRNYLIKRTIQSSADIRTSDIRTLLSLDIAVYGYSIRSAFSICFDIRTEYPDIESKSEQLYSYHATYATL